jgi:Flp pilus assembly protein TadD, contains TPR repeats
MIYPRDPRLLHDFALSLFDLELYEESAQQIALALEIGFSSQDTPKALNSLGNAYQKASRLKEAVDAYSQALQLRPTFVEALKNLAFIFAKQGLFSSSSEACKQVVLLYPGASSGYYFMAEVNHRGPVNRTKTSYYREFLESNAVDTQSTLLKGLSLCHQGNHEVGLSSLYSLKPVLRFTPCAPLTTTHGSTYG